MYPETTSLLPPSDDKAGRALVRVMVNIISNDIQPVTNMKVLKRTVALGGDMAQWARDFMTSGFEAFEAVIRSTAGTYCYGDSVTMADICLAPAVWNAERYGVDMEPFSAIRRVYQAQKDLPSFQRAHWAIQPDCPPELRQTSS